MPRCLISWDHEATGIWLIPSRRDACQPALQGVLSPGLHEELKQWNDWGAELFNGRVIQPDQGQVARWEATKLRLAARVQDELGGDWEVLYQDGCAYTWVRRRWS